jgi:hypothetical protein
MNELSIPSVSQNQVTRISRRDRKESSEVDLKRSKCLLGKRTRRKG